MKKSQSIHLITFLMFLVSISILFSSCGAAVNIEDDEVELLEPIKVNQNYGLFKFAKVISEVSAGKVIGGYYTGWAKVKNEEYISDGMTEGMSGHFRKVVNEELTKSGYRVLKSSTSEDLFSKPDFDSCRFLIGAAIVNEGRNKYSMVGYNGTDVMLNIRWEVFDQQEKKNIFSKTEKGVHEGDDTSEGYIMCIRNSFRNFLGNKELIKKLDEYLAAYPANAN